MWPVRYLASKALPGLHSWYKRRRSGSVKARLDSIPMMTPSRFRELLVDDLGLVTGDTIFIHSSYNRMRVDLSPEEIINEILSVIGDDGTLVVPTYPPMNSIDYLRSEEVFDIKNTPSRTGVLTELVRGHPDSLRSLHPTKSVSAVGGNAEYIVKDHDASPYPYDSNSPYYKIIELDGKYVGLGVNSFYIASLHCVDDILKEEYPVKTYTGKRFKADCIDYEGNPRVVETYAHSLIKTDYNMHTFVKRYIDPDICKDINIEGREFFVADMKPLYEKAVELARKNITIYPRSSYRLNKMFARRE